MLDIQHSHFYSRISIIKLNSTLLFAFKSGIKNVKHSTLESESNNPFLFEISNTENQDQSKIQILFVKYSILDI